jgi:hypothetical protein
MKPILPGFVILALAVMGGTTQFAFGEVAANPDVGRQREFRVVVADLAEIKRRIADAETDVEGWRDRLAWTARMARKGLLSAPQVDNARARLQIAEIALDKLRRDLKRLLAHPLGK